MVAKFYNEGTYKDSFIGMFRMADKVSPFRIREETEDPLEARNLMFMTTDEGGKVFDCSGTAKKLLGVRALAAANHIDSFTVQEIDPSYNPAVLFQGVDESSVYTEKFLNLFEVRERLRSHGDMFNLRDVTGASPKDICARLRVIRERYSLGL